MSPTATTAKDALDAVRASLKEAMGRLKEADSASAQAAAEVKRQAEPFEARKKAIDEEMFQATETARVARQEAWRTRREAQEQVESLSGKERVALGEFELEEARKKVRTVTLVGSKIPGVKCWPTPIGTTIPIPEEWREGRRATETTPWSNDPIKVTSEFKLGSVYVDTPGGRSRSCPFNEAWGLDGVARGVVIGMRGALKPGYGIRECYSAKGLDPNHGKPTETSLGHSIDYLVLSVKGDVVRIVPLDALEHFDINGEDDGVDKTQRVIQALAER